MVSRIELLERSVTELAHAVAEIRSTRENTERMARIVARHDRSDEPEDGEPDPPG